MSKTVDDLMEAFRTGFRQRMQGPGIRPEGDIAIRAGIAAVVRALRDDTAINSCACKFWLDDILGDAGEKVADYICNDVRVIITQDTAYCAPATAPAPAVCEWTVKGRSYTYTDIRTQCGDDVVLSLFATAGRIGTCGKCHRPIKFTEAKT